MSASVAKSRSPVERSYSSASSTTSSRRSGRRKRRRMKHTVMPLKKRAGKHEVACDVHRVSNLDNEEMEQSACFWVAKNIDDPLERSFKEDVFVNKDQDSSDDEMSYLEDGRQSQNSGEFARELRKEMNESRTDSRYDTKYSYEEKTFDADEKENNAKYANEDEKTDANYSEEKTFYGVRKGKMKDGSQLERVSPIPSPRNRSRISSFSDDGQSGFSSEGTGMHVGWTSDVGVSSGPEYSAMTDESDGEGGHKRTRRGSKEFYGYRKKDGEKSEFPARKIRERDDDKDGVVIATDITTTKTTEVENNYENKNYFEKRRPEDVEIDREYYSKEEIERSRHSVYNGRDFVPGIDPREEIEPQISDPLHYEPLEMNGEDFDPPINDQGEFEPRIRDPQYYEPSEHIPEDEGPIPGVRPGTLTGHVHPSSDTELVNFRTFDIDVDRYSDRSLPLGGHKTKTQYYSVEDLIQSAKEEEMKQEKTDSGSDGPEVPRVGEYEKYQPPRDTRVDDTEIRGLHAVDEEPQHDGIESEKPRISSGTYDVKTQRPLLVPRRDKESDKRAKDDLSPRGQRTEVNGHSGTYEESKDFYGYRRTDVRNEYENEKIQHLSPRHSTNKDSGHPTRNETTSPRHGEDDSGRPTRGKRDDYNRPDTGKEFDNVNQQRQFSPKDGGVKADDEQTFEESKEFYGYRQSRTGDEPRDVDDKRSNDQPKNTKWQETKEFYGYKTSKIGSKENLLFDNEKQSGRQPKWEENKEEFYGYRESKTGSQQDLRYQTNGNTTTTFKESREFYGFRSFGSSENISKKGRDGQTWEESKEFFGFRRKQVVDGQTHFAVSGHEERPRSPLQRKLDARPLYLESADDKRRKEYSKDTRDEKENNYDNRPYDNKPYENQPSDKRPYKNQPYDKRPHENQPHDKRRYDKRPHENQPYEKQLPSEERPDEYVAKSKEQDNLMSVDDGQDFDNIFEESREFSGYRRPEDLPRSEAYERYQRPQSRSENVPPGDRITTRGYDVKNTRHTQRESRETTVREFKTQTSEPEIKDSQTDDVYMQPDDVPDGSHPNRDYDYTRKNDPTTDRDRTGRYVPTRVQRDNDPREKHMFNILEIPSSKKVIPLVSDVAPKLETSQTTTTTETLTKRLHTRSQRDNLRREARQPEQTEPEGSDVGMKMFRQRSLPRKHGHPISADEKSKELPRKIIKKTDDPDLSQVNPDFANKFRELTEKRKKKQKNTTETTTKSATESCNKNVEELVNVFNTLEHIQKTTDKNSDKTVQPRQVKNIVKAETLDKASEMGTNLSPATSISQKLNEIEDILDSVDKNRQRGTRNKPEDRQDEPEGGDTRPSTRRTRETYTTRETRETREERETRKTREKYARKPRTSDDVITKQEEMSVESFLDDEPMRDESARHPRREPKGRGELKPDHPRPWAYTDRHPYRPDRRPRGYDKTRSRDDDDEIYRAQIKKSREKSWRDTEKTRKKKYDSKSDGEIEGFKSTLFGDRIITPGTPVNIRLYGLNLQKTNKDRAQDLNWEMFTSPKVPVDESVGRTQLYTKPFEVEKIPETKMPVDESVDRTQLKKQPLDVEEMPEDKLRTEEPVIDRSHVGPAEVNFSPSSDQNDEPEMKDLSMREQQEPLYRRQERLPRKRDAPIARSDSLDDDKVTSKNINWSHPPVSKVRPEKEPSSKIPRVKSPGTEEVMEVDSVTDTNKIRETTRTDITKKSVRKDTTEKRRYRTNQANTEAPGEERPSGKEPQEGLPYEEYPSEEKPLEEFPSEDRPYERYPYGKRPSEKRPYKKRPSEESPDDTEIPIEKVQETETQDEPDALVIEIEYTDDDDDENKLAEKGTLPGDSTLYEKSTLRSSTPKDKPRSPSDNNFDGDSSYMTHEESTERHESTSHESSKGVDTTIHTTRTTKTTRTETTETTVKTIRKSGSDSSRPASQSAPLIGEPDFRTPVRNEPEHSTPDRPARSQPEYSIPETDEPDFRVPVRNDTDVFTEPEYITPVYSQPAPEYYTPTRRSQSEDEPRTGDEPSHVATEFIVLNNDTGRPINLTMLGRLEEDDDDDYLSSHSREDLFLHTRLKMVSENKQKRIKRRPEDAHLLEPDTSEQDDVDHEGSLTSSDEEFDTGDVSIFPESDITDQLLIPISGKIKENVEKQNKPGYMFPNDDDFTPDTQVDEPNLEKAQAPTKIMPDFELIPGFKEPVSENVEFSEKSEVVIEFGEPVKNVDEIDDIEIVELPLFDNFMAQSPEPPDSREKSPIGEPVSHERTSTPTLPEVKYEPVDENITSEKQDQDLNIPVLTDVRPLEPVDENIQRSTKSPKDIYMPDLEEVLPEIKRPSTPILVDEAVTSEQRKVVIDLPHFPQTRPSQPIDEDTIENEQITKEVYVPDFQELIPETKKPALPVDENVTSERRESQVEIPEFQVVEPKRRASEPITEQVSADGPIKSEVFIPDFAMEFQEVVPEFPDSGMTNDDQNISVSDEGKTIDNELQEFQEVEQEPHRNVRITESDLEIEAPSSSSSQSLGTESELPDKTDGDKNDAPCPEDVNKTAGKVPGDRDTYEKDTFEDETWSETHKTVKETRTTETVTVEKTITKYVSEVPTKKDEPVSPRSPKKDRPVSPKAVHLIGSIEPKDSSESSSEPSPRSSSGASADISDRSTDVTPEVNPTDKPEVPARKRRSRRGNRFDNIKRTGSLVPEAVVRDESPVTTDRGSYLPRDEIPVSIVPEREQPVSNVPDSTSSFFTPREKLGQLRPEMYLLDSDDETQEGYSTKPDERVVAELCVPEERETSEDQVPEKENIPGEDGIPARDELSPELMDELLEKEIQGLAEDNEGSSLSEEEPEVQEMITKDEREVPQLENIPDETPEIDETVLAKEALEKDDSPTEIIEGIEKSLQRNEPHFFDEEDGNLPQEEIEKPSDKEGSFRPHVEPEELDEEIAKSVDERVPKDHLLPEAARDEPFEDEVPDEEVQKSGDEDVPDFEVILIEHLNKDDDVSDKSDSDVSEKSDEVSEKPDDVSEKPDDIIPEDDDKRDEDVISKQKDLPEEESTVETVIVEKTHSEVTVTEITAKRYSPSPQDTPPATSEISEEPKVSPKEDEDDYVIIPIDVAKPSEIVKPCEVEPVEGIPDDQRTYDDQPTTTDEETTAYDDTSTPHLIITKEPKRQVTSESDFDKESSSSESSTSESDDERTDSDVNKVVSTEAMAETPDQPTETVFGIVDIKYEKPQQEDILKVEDTVVEIREIPEIPEKAPLDEEDAPTHDDVPMISDVTPKDSKGVELDIGEESTSSSDEELTSGDERAPRGTSKTTVETLVIEKTSTQISTTITKIIASSDESDSEIPITIVPEDNSTLEALPEPEEVSPENEKSPEEKDIVVEPADDKSTTSSDSESTTDKETEPDHVPDEKESPDVNIPVEPADDESTSSSDKESTANDEDGPEEISTVETIVVEKTHSQVSTTITEITTKNAPNYPTEDVLPSITDNGLINAEEAPTTEEIPIPEDFQKTQSEVHESAPVTEECDGLVYEISPAEQFQDTDKPHVTTILTNERESQTEDRDVHNEMTQTDYTTETTRGKTRDAFSMTPTRTSSDSEIQTQIQQGSASTQTSHEEDSELHRYTRTVEEYRESSEKVTKQTRQLSDSETQTDISVEDELATTHEGTQTETSGDFSESEITRITRRTTTETRSESSRTEETRTSPSRDDIKNDCPVCLQSLEATDYSFIKVKDLSRFVVMEEKSSQYEMEETIDQSSSFCFACGRHETTRSERESRRRDQGFSSTSMDITDGYSSTARDELRHEESRSGEGGGFSRSTIFESGQERSTWGGHGSSGTMREEWSYEKSTQETSEYSSTISKEWQQDVVIETESSTEVPEGVHFSIRLDGDEKCLLYCRRSGKHACALEKLASIIEAHRKAATSSTQAGGVQAHTSETDENVETVEAANEEGAETIEAGTSNVIGPQRCDVGVQTDGALLPADFEVFSDKDFEIYYDEQKSPCWFV